MGRSRTSGWTRCVLLAMAWWVAGAAWADAPSRIESTEEFYGPLRARDLSPFGYLRLDMRPPSVADTTPSTWSIETELAYQNTWAISPTARYYLELQPRPRRSLTVADLDAMRAWSSENYLVDLELAQFDLVLQRQLAADWGAFVVLSGVCWTTPSSSFTRHSGSAATAGPACDRARSTCLST
jgi:hypothetical protein